MDAHDLVPFGFFTMVIVIVIGVPLVRGLVKRWERKDAAAPIPSDVTARLERMEAGIDAIAIEIERISEGQRFTTKLLSERESHAIPATSRSAD